VTSRRLETLNSEHHAGINVRSCSYVGMVSGGDLPHTFLCSKIRGWPQFRA
jgi:hypothetical protein